MQRAWIISIGTELTLGQSVDTNSVWLSQRLAALGVRVERHVTVADDLPPIVAVFRDAAARCDLAIVTGGLGPTDDDLARQALADAGSVALETDEMSLTQIRAFFAARGREMPEPNRVQASVPRGGQALPNDCGTAPGVFMKIDDTPFFALPGVPFEMKSMFEAHVAPAIAAQAGGRVLLSRVVRTYGLPESEVGQRLRDLMLRGRNPEVGTTADLGAIGVRINALADSRDEAVRLLDDTQRDVCERLGAAVYGVDEETLAAAVGVRLVHRNETVCTAESCTGGLIGKLLTDQPGSSRYFRGGVVAYANEAKLGFLNVRRDLLETHGAVSQPVAAAMATGARQALKTNWAIAVTGIAGPHGGSKPKPVGTVWIGLAGPGDPTTRELRLGSDSPRDVIRERAARAALNLLRLSLR